MTAGGDVLEVELTGSAKRRLDGLAVDRQRQRTKGRRLIVAAADDEHLAGDTLNAAYGEARNGATTEGRRNRHLRLADLEVERHVAVGNGQQVAVVRQQVRDEQAAAAPGAADLLIAR